MVRNSNNLRPVQNPKLLSVMFWGGPLTLTLFKELDLNVLSHDLPTETSTLPL